MARQCARDHAHRARGARMQQTPSPLHTFICNFMHKSFLYMYISGAQPRHNPDTTPTQSGTDISSPGTGNTDATR